MIEFIAMDLAHQPPAIVQQVKKRKRGSRSRRSADPQPQHQTQQRRKPDRAQFYGAISLGMIVIMHNANGEPYNCLVYDKIPNGDWLCREP